MLQTEIFARQMVLAMACIGERSLAPSKFPVTVMHGKGFQCEVAEAVAGRLSLRCETGWGKAGRNGLRRYYGSRTGG